MKKWILIGIGILVIAAIALMVAFVMQKPVSSPDDTTDTENPFGGASSTTDTGGPVVPLTSKAGTDVFVPEFAAGTPTIEQESGTYYYVTYNSDFQPLDPAYGIVYGTDGSLSIGLFEEPLGSSRAKAEAKLRSLLNLTDEKMCALAVTVKTTVSVNEYYAGRNLGLSFCPGSMQLPN